MRLSLEVIFAQSPERPLHEAVVGFGAVHAIDLAGQSQLYAADHIVTVALMIESHNKFGLPVISNDKKSAQTTKTNNLPHNL